MRERAQPGKARAGPAAPQVVPARRASPARAVGNALGARLLAGHGPPAGAVHPELRALIDRQRSAGSALPAPVAGELASQVGEAARDLRVHAGPDAHRLAGALGADAFATGRDVFFAAGRYAPDTAEGRRLLAHEAVHVVQQGARTPAGELRLAPAEGGLEAEARALARPGLSAAPGLVQRQPAAAGEREEQAWSRNTDWYVESEPGGPSVPVGATVEFRLRSGRGMRLRWAEGRGPHITLRYPDGSERGQGLWETGDPTFQRIQFTSPGRWVLTYEGTPLEGTLASDDNPFAGTERGAPIRVSTEIEVVDPHEAGLGARLAAEPAARDVDRLEDPRSSPAAAVVAFRRVLMRRALDVLQHNREEAQELLGLYTTGSKTQPQTQAFQELEDVAALRDKLLQQLDEASHPSEHVAMLALQEAVPAGHPTDLHSRLEHRRERIGAAIDMLLDAFPALAYWHPPQAGPRAALARRSPEMRNDIRRTLEAEVLVGLRTVIADIDTTERGLVTGDLDPLLAGPVVDEARSAFGMTGADPRAEALDEAIAAAGERRSAVADALGGLSLLLLFVPGIGPALAALAGAGAAAASVQNARELAAAANAGVRGGIVSREAAGEATFWAAFNVVAAGLDIGAQLARAAKALPHAAGAGTRAVEAVNRSLATVAPEEAAAGAAATGPLTMSADELHTFAAEILRRPLRPLAGDVRMYENAEQLAAAYRKIWPDVAARPGWRPPAGFYDPNSGMIHLNRQAGLMTALHEVIHRAAREVFPLGRQVFGAFLDEGLTEAVVRWKLGPRLGRHGYDANVQLVEAIAARVGRARVERCVVQGQYRALRDALKATVFGGSEQRTFQFFAVVRQLAGSEGAASYDRALYEEAMELLGSNRPAPPPLPARPVGPTGAAHDPGAEEAFVERLKQRFPRLRPLDIRPRARPSASLHTSQVPSEELMGATEYRREASGAPEHAFEERMGTSQGGYSYSVYGAGGQVIEIDGISVEGWLEEIKIGQNMGRIDEIMAQLRSQADFAQAYGLRGVRYSISPPAVAAEVEARVAQERLWNTYRVR